MKIWCPGCEWRPKPSSRWVCIPADCRHVWNTFDTGGVCPKCSKIWHDTQCLSCKKRYPHVDWYHDETSVEDDVDVVADVAVGTDAEITT